MTRGIKNKTPLDSEGRKKYKNRRAKNNESAARHRERQKAAVIERDIIKTDRDRLKAELNDMARRLMDVEDENRQLVDFVLTHDCLSPREHREHFYSSLCRARAARPDFLPPQSVASRIDQSDSSSVSFSRDSYASSSFECQQEQMLPRPTGFCMDEYQEFKPSVHQSVPLNQPQQPPRRFRNYQELIETSDTGYTPARHVTLSELNNFPFEPVAQPQYQHPIQARVRPEQFTPLSQFFVNSQIPEVLTVLDDNYVNENLSRDFSYQQL